MLTKFQIHVLMCARALTEANGAFTVDGLCRYRFGKYSQGLLVQALNALKRCGEVLNKGRFYRAIRVKPITEKARNIGEVLVPGGALPANHRLRQIKEACKRVNAQRRHNMTATLEDIA